MIVFVVGSKEERGITAWQAQKVVDGTAEHDVDSEMYYPVLPKAVLTNVLVKYVPFLPHLNRDK